MREGRKGQAHFGIVVAEHSFAVQGRYVERLGFYNPHTKELNIETDKVLGWISKGAKPTTSIARLLKSKNTKGMEKYIKHVKFVVKPKEVVVEKKIEAPAPEVKEEKAEASVEEVVPTTEEVVGQEEAPTEIVEETPEEPAPTEEEIVAEEAAVTEEEKTEEKVAE